MIIIGQERKGWCVEESEFGVKKLQLWREEGGYPPVSGNSTEEGMGTTVENLGGFLASVICFDSMEEDPISIQSSSSFPSFNYLNKTTSLRLSNSSSKGRFGIRKKIHFFKTQWQKIRHTTFRKLAEVEKKTIETKNKKKVL